MTRITIEIDSNEAAPTIVEKKPCRGCGGATGQAEALAVAQATRSTDAGMASVGTSGAESPAVTSAAVLGPVGYDPSMAFHATDAGRAPADES